MFHMENMLLLVLILSSGLTFGDHITPNQYDGISTEGETVTLSCTYETSYTATMGSWLWTSSVLATCIIECRGVEKVTQLE
ncbi:hypothetical protein UPYG_G00289720 [Umbra pygmaea]|uniref:Uncharacterized protein n=1 Tax=Umbra pygmaea TaxID=75934 RepID=A0ABD0WTU1_UMBPY